MKMSNKFSKYQNETLCIMYRQYTTFPYWFKIIFAGDGFSQIIFTEWTHRIACLQKIQRISDDFIFSCPFDDESWWCRIQTVTSTYDGVEFISNIFVVFQPFSTTSGNLRLYLIIMTRFISSPVLINYLTFLFN